MYKKTIRSFLLVVWEMFKLLVGQILIIVIPAIITIYQFLGGDARMLQQIPLWVWVITTIVCFVWVFRTSVLKIRGELNKKNNKSKLEIYEVVRDDENLNYIYKNFYDSIRRRELLDDTLSRYREKYKKDQPLLFFGEKYDKKPTNKKSKK